MFVVTTSDCRNEWTRCLNPWRVPCNESGVCSYGNTLEMFVRWLGELVFCISSPSRGCGLAW